MARFDQTGPLGHGPMTGWKMGRCTNFGAKQKTSDHSENENRMQDFSEEQDEKGFGRGFGFRRGGRGRGMGRQHRFRGGF